MQLNFVSRWLNVVVNVGDTHECESLAMVGNTGGEFEPAGAGDVDAAGDDTWYEEQNRFGFRSCGG